MLAATTGLGKVVKLVGSSLAGEFTNMWRIVRLFLLFFVLAHILGCFFFFVSDFSATDQSSKYPVTGSWVWRHNIHSFQEGDKFHMYIFSTCKLAYHERNAIGFLKAGLLEGGGGGGGG
jgi:hypothetical protein